MTWLATQFVIVHSSIVLVFVPGRSRGGFSTRIHPKTDFDGHFVAFDPTCGEKSDAPHFPILLGLDLDVEPRTTVGDKGYARNANRQAVRPRGIIPSFRDGPNPQKFIHWW
ncbi:transposase [Mesorhizobium sp. A623]